jgi:feruloyl esterase
MRVSRVLCEFTWAATNNRRYSFRPESIACGPASNRSTCLTIGQIAAVRGLYSDYVTSNGTFIFSRWEPGGELAYGSPTSFVAGPDVPLGPEYYKYMVFK